jgi:DNA-binding MarR family transcriptional regulator
MATRSAAGDADPVESVRRHWEEQSLPEPDRFAAVASLLRLRELVASEFDRELRSFEINRSMYLLLSTLVMSPSGARRLNHLSRYLLVHPTTITLLVDQLEKRGMVKRMPDPKDRRASLATLTPAGRAVMKEATRALAAVGYGLGKVSDRELRQLIESMRTARAALKDVDSASG